VSDGLGARLRATWAAQVADGFVLGDPAAPVETRSALDPATGVRFRFRWLPHREVRSDPAELVRRGILDPACLEGAGGASPGDGCFLCTSQVRRCFPSETLLPIEAGGRRWWAGANFAWLAADHFTVMSDAHVDQAYDRGVLEAMLDLHHGTEGRFRVIFNGVGAGATIPWHLHLQVTSDPLPVEALQAGTEEHYPVPLGRFGDAASAHRHVAAWMERDPRHRVNLLVAGPDASPVVHVVRRDARRTHASRKGLMGGFEVAGDFAYSEPAHRADFESADLHTAREALAEIAPPSPQ